VSQIEKYRVIVRRGEAYQGSLEHFIGTADDSFTVEQVPAGDAEMLFLKSCALIRIGV